MLQLFKMGKRIDKVVRVDRISFVAMKKGSVIKHIPRLRENCFKRI
jgi:hypothetical protein